MRKLICSLAFASILSAADVEYDGSRVHYESYGEGKEAVVFIHGWTCDLTFWRGQAPVYNKRRALLIDLPGHGQSAKPEVNYTQERFARAVEAVMSDAGLERAVIVGHSMGGPVGFTFLRLFPARIKALVMVDAMIPPAPKDEADRAKQKAQMDPFIQSFRAPNYKETTKKMIESMFSEKTTPAMRDEIRSKMSAAPQHVVVSAMEGMFGMEPPRVGETYLLPMMAINAVAPGRASYEGRFRALFLDLRKYEAWEGSGHFLMMESPERFNKVLTEFLDSLK